jgi:type 1 glutamine amidotransferase
MMSVKMPLWKKIIVLLSLLAVLLFAAFLIFALYSGAWRVFFPSTAHDTLASILPAELGPPSILVFSKTNSFRHADGIEGGNRALEEIATGNDWQLYATENGAIFNKQDLQRFNAVVFLNATGNMLSTNQEQVFQTWLEAGGGWIGIHAAGDSSHAGWTWYMDNLIGADFTAHTLGPQFQQATVVREAVDHPVVQRLPGIWSHTDEWYSWERSPRLNGFTILATVDEKTYSPRVKFMGLEKDLHMGDHPVVWSNCVGGGRALYTAMGHKADSFDNAEHRLLLEDALYWVMALREGGCQ